MMVYIRVCPARWEILHRCRVDAGPSSLDQGAQPLGHCLSPTVRVRVRLVRLPRAVIIPTTSRPFPFHFLLICILCSTLLDLR